MPVSRLPEHDIAVIIVNYNVKSFLNFCLESVYVAAENLNVEIIVVDNASTDGSLDFLNTWHKNVKIIASKLNEGFSKGCNRGIEASNSKYILFLNPDTILNECALTDSINHFDSHDDIGAIGLKMIDGSGKYLPESKRGKITPSTALFKQLGLSRVFPKSSFFNQYYLGQLDKNKTQNIEVLTGAFFFTSTEVLEKVGNFDERFHMYGEDIDLSYRITAIGKKLIYLSSSSIIHFKGESTEKSSLLYFDSFYGSMKLFIDKYYSKGTRLTYNVSAFIRCSYYPHIWYSAVGCYAAILTFGGCGFDRSFFVCCG